MAFEAVFCVGNSRLEVIVRKFQSFGIDIRFESLILGLQGVESGGTTDLNSGLSFSRGLGNSRVEGSVSDASVSITKNEIDDFST